MGLPTFAIKSLKKRTPRGPALFMDWRASPLKLAETKRFKSGVMACAIGEDRSAPSGPMNGFGILNAFSR